MLLLMDDVGVFVVYLCWVWLWRKLLFVAVYDCVVSRLLLLLLLLCFGVDGVVAVCFCWLV